MEPTSGETGLAPSRCDVRWQRVDSVSCQWHCTQDHHSPAASGLVHLRFTHLPKRAPEGPRVGWPQLKTRWTAQLWQRDLLKARPKRLDVTVGAPPALFRFNSVNVNSIPHGWASPECLSAAQALERNREALLSLRESKRIRHSPYTADARALPCLTLSCARCNQYRRAQTVPCALSLLPAACT